MGARGKIIVDITHFLVVERFYFILLDSQFKRTGLERMINYLHNNVEINFAASCLLSILKKKGRGS